MPSRGRRTAAASQRPGGRSARSTPTCPRGRSARSSSPATGAASDPRVAELAERGALRPHDGHVPDRRDCLVAPRPAGRELPRARGDAGEPGGTPAASPAGGRPGGPDELEWLARLGERFGVAIEPWAAPAVADGPLLAPRRRVRLDAAGSSGGPGSAAGRRPRARPLPAALQRRRGRARLRSSSSSARRPRSSSAHGEARDARDRARARPCASARTARRRSCRARLNRQPADGRRRGSRPITPRGWQTASDGEGR